MIKELTTVEKLDKMTARHKHNVTDRLKVKKLTLRLNPNEYEIVNRIQRENGCSFSVAVRKVLRESWIANGYTECPVCLTLHNDKYCPECGL